MTVFQINQPSANEDNYTVAVNGENFGSTVSAAQFRSVEPVVATGLSLTFGVAASNDDRYHDALTKLVNLSPDVNREQTLKPIGGMQV